jgi:hypothetical protein
LSIGQNGQYLGETWWFSGDGSAQTCANALNNGTLNTGCGGWGTSSIYPAPTWQLPFITPTPLTPVLTMSPVTPGTIIPRREVPDVSAFADPGIIYPTGADAHLLIPTEACKRGGA